MKKSFYCAEFLIYFTLLLMILFGVSKAELEQSKNRRGGGGTSGLFAYPRVGRSDPNMNHNNLHETDSLPFDALYQTSLEEYDEFPKSEIKRAMNFPRVGRTDAEMRKWARWMALQQSLEKRTGPSATSGLWFGPRLGKRSIDVNEFAEKAAHKENNFN